MTIPASAENTMKFLVVNNMNSSCINNSNDGNDINKEYDKNNSDLKNENQILFKDNFNNDSDDDMVVIILEEDLYVKDNSTNSTEKSINIVNENNEERSNLNKKKDGEDENVDEEDESQVECKKCSTVTLNKEQYDNRDSGVEYDCDDDNKNKCKYEFTSTNEKYIGIEVYTHFQQEMESKKMYPVLPCNMISLFAHVMEHVEYFDIPSEERKKLVIDVVKILTHSNNEYGSRECFEYFVQHNMIDDIIQTIIDSTKNRYHINRFPHTNRKIILSCVSLSNKIKIIKPSTKFESLFEEFKLNLCGLKRFFKIRDKDESKQT